ncbi:hypothetical protein L1987_06065 [Smallanthus sonchifolius]|uniref:Uncharacterized protein n=1 Tax=Smallanthus sonchifolius TaxID=185202 RepID=A0ACB9JX40_9ASTR|nr:hypothetical protein L1987_06065 [Smallanthus sonchifolius]
MIACASKLKVLGSGFEVITVGKRKLAQGFVTVEEVERRLSWSSGRASDALETLLQEGLAMIDDGKRRYWFLKYCSSFKYRNGSRIYEASQSIVFICMKLTGDHLEEIKVLSQHHLCRTIKVN